MTLYKSVAIMGGGGYLGAQASTIPGMSVWTCNGLLRDKNIRVSRWFELHRREYLSRVMPSDAFLSYCRFMRDLKNVVTFDFWPEANRHWRIYPVEEVEKLAPLGKWHCGSFDWMVALAILEGFETINLYGVQFMRGGEPISAPAALAYWLGVASGRGIGIQLFNCDAIGKTYQLLESERQYGREDVILVERA